MSDPRVPRHKTLFLVLAALLAIWGVLGALDIPNQPFSGYATGAGFEVANVAPGSPAALVGMQEGDRIVSIAGTPTDDGTALAALSRPGIGETRTIVVERSAGESSMEISMDLTYTSPPGNAVFGGYIGLLIGAAFLFVGMWAYLTAPHAGTLLLAVLGLLLGPALLLGPYVPPGVLTSLLGVVAVSGVTLAFAVLLDFVLRSGRANGYEAGGGGPRWLYWPAIAIALLFAALNTFQPVIDGALNIVLQIAFAAFFLFYFTGSLVMVLMNHRRVGAELRAAHGLGLMLAGAVIGLVPLTVAFLAGLLPGNVTIPGTQYMALALIAVPVTFSLAAVRKRDPGGLVDIGEATSPVL